MPSPRRTRPISSFSLVALTLLLTSLPASAQSRVDLRSRQTPLKDQGSRTTCITFSALAALEAAYKRAGYGNLDLSEEFANYMGKMNWLHPNWNSASGPAPQLGTLGAGFTEGGIGIFGGGNGTGYIKNLKYWLGVPLESYMPYRQSPYSQPYPARDPRWDVQTNTSNVNLDPINLSRRALTAPRYYGVNSFATMSATSTSAIEGALRKGYEVVWDFDVKTNYGTTWQYSSSASKGAHSMLIVGYDRTSASSANHYFICKNSWGSWQARNDGFTYISYDLLRRCGRSASYIASVKPAQTWPELAFLGRWNLCFDGHRGNLDIYHLPGASTAWFSELSVPHADRRVGTFRDNSGRMYRVNGIVSGNRLEFWFRGQSPNMCWDESRSFPYMSRRFIYYMIDPKKGEMAGWHHDNISTTPAYGGYARVPSTISGSNGFLNPVFDNNQPWEPENYLGLWNVAFDGTSGRVSFQERDDSLLSVGNRANYAGVKGEFIDGSSGRRYPLVAMVRRTRTADIYFDFTHATRGRVKFRGFMLSWQRGVFAGNAELNGSYRNGFYAYRTGTAITPGTVTNHGNGCFGSNGRLLHSLSPALFLGKKSVFYGFGGPSNGTGLMAFGIGRTNLLLPGTSCLLQINPVVTVPIQYGGTGKNQFPINLSSNRSMFGGRLYTQQVGLDPQANSHGLTLSNTLELTIGGYR